MSTIDRERPTSLSFSGGRTSGYMLIRHLLDQSAPRPVVTFCNTGKERDETLDFVNECSQRWGVDVVWLEYTLTTIDELDAKYAARGADVASAWEGTKRRCWAKWQKRCGGDVGSMLYHDFKVVDYATAHRNGEPDSPFDKVIRWVSTLPNVQQRYCTAEMKIRTMDRYLSSIGMRERRELIGIRADEAHRTLEIRANAPKRITPLFPLVESGVTEADVMHYWSTSSFDLQLDTYEGNCDLCFLKAAAKLRRLIHERPQSADWWIEKEREKEGLRDGAKFRADRASYAVMKDRLNDPVLFNIHGDDDIACSCTEGGYRYLVAEEDA